MVKVRRRGRAKERSQKEMTSKLLGLVYSPLEAKGSAYPGSSRALKSFLGPSQQPQAVGVGFPEPDSTGNWQGGNKAVGAEVRVGGVLSCLPPSVLILC